MEEDMEQYSGKVWVQLSLAPAADGCVTAKLQVRAAASSAASAQAYAECPVCRNVGPLLYINCCSKPICRACHRKVMTFEEAEKSDDESQDVTRHKGCPYCRQRAKGLTASRALNSMPVPEQYQRSEREALMSKAPGEELMKKTISVFARSLWAK